MKITEYPSATSIDNNDLLFIDGEGGPRKMAFEDFKKEFNLPFELAIDENGIYGYKKVGADTVTPFKSVSGIFEIDTPGVYDVKSFETAIVNTRNPIVTVTMGTDLNIDPIGYHNVFSYWDPSLDKQVTYEKDMYCFITKQRYDLLFLHISDTNPLYTDPEDISWDEGYDNDAIQIYGSKFEDGVYKGPDEDAYVGDLGEIHDPEFTTIDGYGHIKTSMFKNVPANASIIYMSSGLSPYTKGILSKSFGVTYT